MTPVPKPDDPATRIAKEKDRLEKYAMHLLPALIALTNPPQDWLFNPEFEESRKLWRDRLVGEAVLFADTIYDILEEGEKAAIHLRTVPGVIALDDKDDPTMETVRRMMRELFERRPDRKD